MEHREYEKAPSTLLPAVLERLGLSQSFPVSSSPELSKEAFEDVDWHVRVRAVIAAGEHPELFPVETLINALHDEDMSVRAAAVRVLGGRKGDIPFSYLEAALHDDDWLVREVAALTLEEIDEQRILRPVEHMKTEGKLQNEANLDDDEVTFVDLDPVPTASWLRPHPISLRSRVYPASNVSARWSRSVMGALAVLVVMVIVTSWLVLLPRLHSTGGQHVSPQPGSVLFTVPSGKNTPNTSYYLPSWTSDSRYMSYVDSQGHLYVWDSVTRQVKKTISLTYQTISPDPNATWFPLPGGKYIISNDYGKSSSGNSTTRHQVWNVLTGHTVLPYDAQAFGFSSDGTYAAFVDSKGMLEIWNVNAEKRLQIMSSPHFRNAFDITWASNGHYIESGYYFAVASSDGYVQLIDALPGTVIKSFQVQLPLNTNVQYGYAYLDTWTPDLNRALFATTGNASSTTYQVWDAFAAQKLGTYRMTQADYGDQWFEDGTRILSQTGNAVRVWDAATGRTLLSFASSGYSPPVLSSDNALLVYSDEDNTVQVWSMVSYREVLTYRGHKAAVVPGSIAISPDGKYVSSVDSDGHMQVWNVATGKMAFTYSFPYYLANTTVFLATMWSPDEKMIALTSDGGTVTVLEAP